MSIALLNMPNRLWPVARPSAPAPAASAPSLPTAGLATLHSPVLASSRLTLDDLEGADAIAGAMPIPDDAAQALLGGAARPTLRAGARGESVRVLQQALADRGFNPGRADGVMGNQTVRALKQFQAREGLDADGVAGVDTWNRLNAIADVAPASPAAPAEKPGLMRNLMNQLGNRYRNARHQCFRYAWTMVAGAGGRGIGSANASHAGRNQPITHLKAMIADGSLKPGDVIYANRRPGADPSSRNLKYGPHWFVYLGNNRFADQYGVRDADAMQAFVPGRKLDTIYHPF